MKNIKNFEVGMRIRISKDPKKSIQKFKGSIAKREMAGTIQTITRVNPIRNAIHVKKNGKGLSWTIHLDDVIELKLLPKIKPATFNIENLILE